MSNQIRFTLGDADTLKQAGQILADIRSTIAAALQDQEKMPEGAYQAVRILHETSLVLQNWAVMIEDRGWQKLLEPKK